MPQYRNNSGESQHPAPEEPVKPSRVGDVAGETRESVADTVAPLRIAIENLATAVPDEDFARRYGDLHIALLSSEDKWISDAVRTMIQRRESFNAALIELFEAVLSLRRDPSEEELRSIGALLRTVDDLRMHNILTEESLRSIRTLVPRLFTEGRFAFLGTAIHYSTMCEIVLRSLDDSVRAGGLSSPQVLHFYEQMLVEATTDDERDFCMPAGLEHVMEHALMHNHCNIAVVAAFILRSMEHEAREMEKRWATDYTNMTEPYFRMLLRKQHWSRDMQTAVLRWLEDRGLDAMDVMDWWSHGAGWPVERIPQFQAVPDTEKKERISPEVCYMRNVRRCIQLEAHSPGCLPELRETFNLHDVGRYAPETLIAQFEERENVHQPYVLVIFPYDDHNGAFYCDAAILEDLRRQLAVKGHLLRIIEAEGETRSFLRTLAHLHKEKGYPLPSGIVLGAHGKPYMMEFSSSHPLSLKTVWKRIGERLDERTGMEEGMERLFQKKARQRPIVLVSCSTGQPDGIAHVLSGYTGGIVSGPQIPTNVAAISAQFDENGQLTALVPTFQQGKTGVFKAGQEMPVAEEDVLEAIPVEEELPP